MNYKRLCAVVAFNLGLVLLANQPVIAAPSPDFIYVQVPSSNPNRNMIYQPVVPPAPLARGSWDNIAHLWPRMISYTMETDAVNAFIQPDLKIGMQYNYSFNFELNARNGQGQSMSVPDGWYQLQIAVIKKVSNRPVVREDRYVTSTSMFLRVTGGAFGRKVSLRFPDVTATSLKHHLFVELIPLKNECHRPGTSENIPCIQLNEKGEPDPLNSILQPQDGYKTYLVEMPFIPFHPGGGKVRDADDLSGEDLSFLGGKSLAEYISRAQLRKTRPALIPRQGTTPETHASRNKLNLISFEDPSLAKARPVIFRLLQEDSTGVITINETDKDFYRDLCSLLNAQQTEFQQRHRQLAFRRERQIVIRNKIERCANNPSQYMHLSKVAHIGQVNPARVERVAQKSLNYSLMGNYMAIRNNTQDVSTTVGLKPPSIVVTLLDQFGFLGTHTVTSSSSRSQVEAGMGSMSTVLDFNYVILKLTATGFQRCLEVRPLQDRDGFFYNPRTNSRNGLYICTPKSQETHTFTETYAHVFERCKDTTMMECDALTQSLNVSLRGEREISAFFYAIRAGISPDHNNRVMPFGNIKNAEKYFASTPSTGLKEVITPIDFPSSPAPSFWKKISGDYQETFN